MKLSSKTLCLSLSIAALLAACGGGDEATLNDGTNTGNTNNVSTCAATSTTLTYTANKSATGNPFTDGEKVCFEASATALTFKGKTLTSPTQNTAVTGDYAAYKFIDGTSALELVLQKGALYEINVISAADSSKFFGQFAK